VPFNKKFLATFMTALFVSSMAASISTVSAQVLEETTPLFTLHALVSSANPDRISAATIWKEELAKLGIELKIEVLESASISARMWGSNWNKSWDEGGWDLTTPGMYNWIWDPTSLLWWESCYTAIGIPPWGWNNFGWTNSLADNLVREFFSTFDEEERRELIWKWQEIFVEDPPKILNFYPYWVLIHNKKLSGFQGWRIEGWQQFDDKYNLRYEGKTFDDYVSIVAHTSSDVGLTVGWNPFFTDGAPYRGVHTGILTMGEGPIGFEIQPFIAKSWEWSEDFMSMTFYLRDDVYWDDGVKMTAEDVVFSVDAALDPATGSLLTGDFAPVVDHAEALNETTVKVYLKDLYPDLAGLFVTYHFYVVPKHVLGNVPHSEWRTHETNLEGGKLPGLGPYIFKEWVKNDYWTLVKSETFFGKDATFIDEITYRVIPDAMTALAALERGEVDIHGNPAAVMAELTRLKQEGKVAVTPYPKPGISFIAVNRNHPILANRHVVRALWYALPLARIRDEIYNGNGEIANSAIHPMMPFYNPNVQQPTYNLAQARAELAMAGYVWPRKVEVPTTLYYTPAGGGFAGGFVVAAVIVYAVMRRKVSAVSPPKSSA